MRQIWAGETSGRRRGAGAGQEGGAAEQGTPDGASGDRGGVRERARIAATGVGKGRRTGRVRICAAAGVGKGRRTGEEKRIRRRGCEREENLTRVSLQALIYRGLRSPHAGTAWARA